MSISDEFARLQALHDSGTLTEAEFTAAKAKVLAEENPAASSSTGTVRQDLRRLQIQNELLRLDQDWESEREDYTLRGRYGSRIVPTESKSISGAVFMCVFAFVIIGFGANAPQGSPLMVIGVLGIIGGIWSGIWGCCESQSLRCSL